MGLSLDRSDMSHSARLAGYGAASTALALLSDRRLGNLVDEAPLISSGVGGTAVLLEIEGTPVFAKQVPLTDLERRPENVMSTANVFRLPTFCQYGLGSGSGFGVWRELAVHAMTTNWVLGRQCESFPLMYHWRVLAGPPPRTPTSEERADLARTVAYWDGSPAVRERLEAVTRSSASVVLFLEYIPQNLHEWLTAQVALGDDAVESACAMVERSLRTGVSFMNSNGLLHFDAHFENILTDGRHLYFADFGLAKSSRFDFEESESGFFAEHLSYDRDYTTAHLVNWLATALCSQMDRKALLREYAEGGNPGNLPKSVTAIIKRYAPIVAVMNKFYRELQTESRTTPYPVDEVNRAWCDVP
ncbi:serine/threonine protein phosphatase [Streptosporangium sp. NPDC087985]|uniref:protein kinase domain-containing protein n=1 Tax=Streptosporangium sp. NPDC087985 TaxID=3366196 RepID=UPI003812CCC7